MRLFVRPNTRPGGNIMPNPFLIDKLRKETEVQMKSERKDIVLLLLKDLFKVAIIIAVLDGDCGTEPAPLPEGGQRSEVSEPEVARPAGYRYSTPGQRRGSRTKTSK